MRLHGCGTFSRRGMRVLITAQEVSGIEVHDEEGGGAEVAGRR